MTDAAVFVLPTQAAGELLEPPQTPTRLQAYSRYVALVAEQIQALESGDLVRLRELKDERATLEPRIENPAAEEDGTDPSPALADLATLLDQSVVALEEKLEADRALQERWKVIRDDTLRLTRSIPAPRVACGRYLEPLPFETRVDVRF